MLQVLPSQRRLAYKNSLHFIYISCSPKPPVNAYPQKKNTKETDTGRHARGRTCCRQMKNSWSERQPALLPPLPLLLSHTSHADPSTQHSHSGYRDNTTEQALPAGTQHLTRGCNTSTLALFLRLWHALLLLRLIRTLLVLLLRQVEVLIAQPGSLLKPHVRQRCLHGHDLRVCTHATRML